MPSKTVCRQIMLKFPNSVNSSLMSVFSLRMLEEKGRLIALYDPEMGHLSKLLDRGRGLPHPKLKFKCEMQQNINM